MGGERVERGEHWVRVSAAAMVAMREQSALKKRENEREVRYSREREREREVRPSEILISDSSESRIIRQRGSKFANNWPEISNRSRVLVHFSVFKAEHYLSM